MMLCWKWRHKFTIQRLNWLKISVGDIIFLWFKKRYWYRYFCREYCCFSTFILIIFFKIYNITLDPDQDPKWARILDPYPNSIYLDPQHCMEVWLQVGWRGWGERCCLGWGTPDCPLAGWGPPPLLRHQRQLHSSCLRGLPAHFQKETTDGPRQASARWEIVVFLAKSSSKLV